MNIKTTHKTGRIDGRTLLFLLALPFLGGCSPEDPKETERLSLEKRVDAYVRSLPEDFSGTILLAANGEILLNQGYGQANRSYGIPNDPDTRFLLGSVTKQFTAVLALQLVEEGLLDLDATVASYLPEYAGPGAGMITVHHLLSHTSGIPHHYLGIPGYIRGYDQLFHTPREYLKTLAGLELVHEPGAGRTYTSPGYSLLAMILERVAAKSYAELLKEKILDPLGMGRTAVGNNLTVHDRIATGYKRGLRGLVLAEQEQESNRLGAGSIHSTTEDLYRFLRILDFEGDDLLSPESKRALLQRRTGSAAYAGNVLLFPYDEDRDTLTIVSTGGSSYGFNVRADRLVEHDAAIIVMSNVQSDVWLLGQVIDEIGDYLLEILEVDLRGRGEADEPSPPPSAPTPDLLASCEGYYGFDDGTIIGVFSDGTALYRHIAPIEHGGVANGTQWSPLSYLEGRSFTVDRRPGYVWRFVGDAFSPAEELEVKRGEPVLDTGRRIEAPASVEASEYAGLYYSVELQRTFRLIASATGLAASEFIAGEDAELRFLGLDLFGYPGGYILFHRDADGVIQDFRLDTEKTDGAFGSRFVRM